MGSMKGHLRASYRRECTYLAPITDRDLAGAAEEAHTAEEMRERLKDEDELAIRALELDGLTRRQLLQRLTKFVAEMDRLANEMIPPPGHSPNGLQRPAPCSAK
jgi:hypothetical protein